MEEPIDAYKRLKDIHEIKQLAYGQVFVKYIIKNDKAEKKLTDVDSTDQETLISHLNGGLPIPGLMYTFIYNPNKDEPILVKDGKRNREYFDKVPIVFCVNTVKGRFSGINMNTLPETERVKFLQMFYKEYEKFFKNSEELTQNNKIALNKQFLEIAKGGDAQLIIKAFSVKAGANFNYGYRTYDMTRVMRLRMIEFSEWDYLPFYNPKDAFKLLNQAQVHNLYWRNR